MTTETQGTTRIDLRDALPHGQQAALAEHFGISRRAVRKALKDGRPGNRVVAEAARICREAGTLSAAQDFANLSA